MAKLVEIDEGDEISTLMEGIKKDFGPEAARGEPTRSRLVEIPDEPKPTKKGRLVPVDEPAPVPLQGMGAKVAYPKGIDPRGLRLPAGASVSPEGNLRFPNDIDLNKPREPKWYDRPLEIAGSVLSAPGDYTRGLLKGRPGERVSGLEMFNANEVDTPEQFMVRSIAGDLVDPLFILGGGMLGRAGKPARTGTQAAGRAPETLVPSIRQELQGPPVPPIQDLARSRQYVPPDDAPVNYQPRRQDAYQPDQVTPVELTPTGSTTRNFPEDPGTTVTSPALQVTPSGSLVRRQNPEVGRVAVPDPTAVPYMPGIPRERGLGDVPSPLLTAEEKIRAKHPEAFQRPPSGVMKTAEDLLAEKQARQYQLHQEMLREREAMLQAPTTGTPQGPASPFYPTPGQAGPGSTLFRKDNLAGEQFSSGLLGKIQRFATRSYDVLSGTGPVGQELASIRYYADDYARQATSTNMTDWVSELQRIYKPNTKFLRDPRREWSTKDYINISDKEYEALFDLTYSGGKYTKTVEALDPAAQIRVKDAWEKGWPIATGRASSDPGVRQLTVKNRVTGEETPLGMPSSFVPHQYTHGKDTGKFGERTIERMYKRYQEGKAAPLTFTEFKEALTSHAANKEKRFLGVEEARLFDAQEIAAETGKSIHQVMKEHGLDTDLLRTMVRYNLGAYHRGQIKMHEPRLRELEKQWLRETAGDPEARSWLNLLDSREKGRTVHEDIDRANNAFVQQWKAFNALTLLPRAAIASVPQINYALSKASMASIVDSLMMAERTRVAQLVPQSGALLSNTIQEMSRVDGWIGAGATAELRLNQFNNLDRLQRNTAARLGFYYAKDLGRRLLKNPDDISTQRALQELRLNPPEVLDSMKAIGTLDDGLAKRAMQVFSDQTMGTTGLRGRPLWSTSDHWSTQMMLTLRGQTTANMAEARKLIFDAPDMWTGVTRASKLLVGSTLFGTAAQTMRDVVTGQFGELKGTAKELEKKLGSEVAARLINGMVYGLGAIAVEAAMTAFAAKDDYQFASAVVGVPMSNLGTMHRFTQDPARTFLKTVPSPYPLDKAAESAGILQPKRQR